jgi:hypothetical protein
VTPSWRQKCPACGQWIDPAPDDGAGGRLPACAACGWRAAAGPAAGRGGRSLLVGGALVAVGVLTGWATGRAGDPGVWWALAAGPGGVALVAAWSRGVAFGWLLVHAAGFSGAFLAAAPAQLAVGGRTPVAILLGILTLGAGWTVGAWSRWRSA